MKKEKSSNLTCPFWSWNGKITKSEIKKQLTYFVKVGYGGFFIHTRTGLETEYLSKKWFSLINYCIKESKKLGLKVYFYDEDRYPSGTCGGEVTNDKRFARKHLNVAVANEFVGEYYDNVVAVFSAKFNGDYLVKYQKYSGQEGKVLVFYFDYASPSSYFNGQPYLDTINKRAAERFILSTHEKYKKHCKKSFGKDAFGIFTDEVGYGHVFCENQKNNLKQNKQVPYTYGLFESFIDKYGYDLRDYLPELFFRKEGRVINKIAWQYINLLQELFLENFAKPYGDWCKKNDLKFTGHILQEETLSTQTACCGSAMRFYEYMDYPGIDVLREESVNEWKIKQLVSVKKQLGKEHAVAECYGATGYNVTLERYKKMSDVLTVFGITLKVPHMAWYTMKGRIKRDYPSNLFYQTSGYEYAKILEEYSNNLNNYILNGEDQTNVAVISPIESVWATCHSEAFEDDSFCAKDENIKEIEKRFENTFYALLDKNIDFDYLDEGLMEKYCSIIHEDGKAKLKMGEKQYDVIIAFDNVILRQSSFNILKQFVANGGKVYLNPSSLEYINFEKIENFDLNDFILVNHLEELTKKVKLDCNLKIDSSKDLIFNVRKVEDGYNLFAFNLGKERLNEGKIVIDGEYNVYEIDLLSNQTLKAVALIEGNQTIINTSFESGEARLFKIINGEIECENLIEEEGYQEINIPEELEYSLSEENVLLIDNVRFYIDGEFCGEEYTLTADNYIRNRFSLEQKKELMCQPYYKRKYEKDYDKVLCNLKLEYDFNCEDIPDKISLAIEQLEDFTVNVNGVIIDKSSSEFWIDNCFSKILIPNSLLRLGENVITLACDYKDEINLENVYLLGEFGVKEDYKTITKLPKTLKLSDVTKQSLPFYSGRIVYTIPVKGSKAKVCFNGENGYHQGVIVGENTLSASFYPYQTNSFKTEDGKISIEICLSRQNTFGPIHNKDKFLAWNGPFAYVDFKTGNFSKTPILKEQGLIIKPTILIKE